MRKNKKLMLGAIAAMGVMAMGVGGVGTFAWYQANSLGGQVKSVEDSTNLSVSDPNYVAESVDLPLNIRVEPANNKTLELAHYYTAAEMDGNARADGGTWEKDSGHTYQPDSGAANYDLLQTASDGFYRAWYKTASTSSIVYDDGPLDSDHVLTKVFTIYAQVKFPTDTTGMPTVGPTTDLPKYWNDGGTVKWRDANLNDWIESAVVSKLNGQTPKFDIVGTGANNRAMFFGAGTSSSPTEGTGSANPTDITAVQLATIDTEMPIGYFGYYVEGENGGVMDAKASSVNGNFKVTVHA